MLNEQVVAGAQSWRPRTAIALLLSYFGLFGLLIGSQGVLWAEVVRALSLSKTVFGTVQLVAPLLSVVLLLAAGRIDRALGKKRMALGGLALLAAAQVAIGRAPGLGLLIFALLLTGAGNALLEAAMNSATLDWERATGRSVMNAMHAGFSGGAVVGAFGAGRLLEAGWAYNQIFVLLTLLAVLNIAATLPIAYPPAQAGEADGATTTIALPGLLRQPLLIVLALVSLLGVVGESVANLWSVIYLRELGAGAFLAGAAFGLFNVAMLVGRLLNTPLVSRYGARVSLIVSGAGVALATLLLLPGGIMLGIISFALLGLAVAGVVPTALSAAARLMPGNSGAITGAIMAVAYSGFVVIPPLTGWIADTVSLQAALVSVGLSGIAILWLARRVE
jgi:fucose permease